MSESVVSALAKVMDELPAIGKGDKSPEGYSYRGIEAITKHLQPLLAKHGVVIAPFATLLRTEPSPAMKEGWTDAYLSVTWRIYGPDGSMIEAQTNGVGRDRSDKMLNKAQTQAYKYLLLHLLSIADKDDDSDGQTYEHDRVEYVPDAADKLFDKVKATKGSPKEAELKALSVANGGLALSANALRADPRWFELVSAVVG